jgi:hypothetical protein
MGRTHELKETATVFKVSREMVWRSVAWVAAWWGLAHRDLSGIEASGVDELHHGKGKTSTRFITLIYQIRRRLPPPAVDRAAPGRSSKRCAGAWCEPGSECAAKPAPGSTR